MNNEDMSNLMNTFQDMMKEGKVPDNIKSMLGNFTSSNSDANSSSETATDSSDVSSNGTINPEMVSNIMNFFNANSSSSHSDENNKESDSDSNKGTGMPNIDIEMLLKMKGIMEKMNSNKNDPRSNLLLSLKPYLKESRKEKVDQYIKLFNMTKVMEVFNNKSGEKTK